MKSDVRYIINIIFDTYRQIISELSHFPFRYSLMKFRLKVFGLRALLSLAISRIQSVSSWRQSTYRLNLQDLNQNTEITGQ
jgi:hypothetical protein